MVSCLDCFCPCWSTRCHNHQIIKGYERKVSQYLQRWQGLPRSLSSIAFFRRKNKLQLPHGSLTEEFMVTWAGEVLLYRDSYNIKVSSADIKVRTGRKRRA